MRKGTIHVSPSRMERFKNRMVAQKRAACFAKFAELIPEMAYMADGEIVRQKIIEEWRNIRSSNPRREANR